MMEKPYGLRPLLKTAAAAALLVLLAGCAQLAPLTGQFPAADPSQATTARESYVRVEETYDGALRLADDLVTRGIISTPADKARLADVVRQARLSMDAAAAAVKRNDPTASVTVESADTAVAQLLAYVKAKEKPDAGRTGRP